MRGSRCFIGVSRSVPVASDPAPLTRPSRSADKPDVAAWHAFQNAIRSGQRPAGSSSPRSESAPMLPWAQPTRQLAMILRLNFGSARRFAETPAPSPRRTTTSVEVPRNLGARSPLTDPTDEKRPSAPASERACRPTLHAATSNSAGPVHFFDVSQVAPCQPNDWS